MQDLNQDLKLHPKQQLRRNLKQDLNQRLLLVYNVLEGCKTNRISYYEYALHINIVSLQGSSPSNRNELELVSVLSCPGENSKF